MAAATRGTVLIGGHGTQHSAEWQIEDGNITVTIHGEGSQKTAPISGSAHMPDALAQLLLGEMINEQRGNASRS